MGHGSQTTMADTIPSPRYPLSEEQRKILISFYEEGVQSKGMACASFHLQAQEATNLPLDVIQGKGWCRGTKLPFRK